MLTKKQKIQLVIATSLWVLIGTITLMILNYKGNELSDTTWVLIGKNIFVLAFLILLGFYMLHFKAHVFLDIKQMLLFSIVYLLVMIPSLLLVETEIIWVIPFTLFGMVVALMMDEILGIMANVVVTLIIGIVGNLTMPFVLFFIISGSVAPILVMKAKVRENMLAVALYLMAINGSLALISGFLTSGRVLTVSLAIMAYSLIHAALGVILAYGSLPLWESLLGILTPFRLAELTNSNQKLLQQLMSDAPGTYHHVQMVANLSEIAAADIGANPLLARAGALYHDIGKLKSPEYFVENQNGENPHDGISPDASAGIIIGHVAEGVKLAKEFHLPQPIIEQHHGTSLVKYFYQKALDHSDGFVIEEAIYHYNGPKPQSLEAVIVMLADISEAAIRARKLKAIEDIGLAIHELIQSRVVDGQLDESDLKLKDLVRIEKAFIKVYNGKYHERIKYKEE